MHLAGVVLLALFAVAQVPAVVYLARYCDRGDEGLPPAVRFRREGGPREGRDANPTHDGQSAARASGQSVGGHDAPGGQAGPVDDRGGRADGDGDVAVIAAADAAAATRDRRRCPRCGADNRPGYVRCRGCLGRLEPPDGWR